MKMFRCIYLCAREHRLDDIQGVEFWYNDIEDYPGIDFVCDALSVDIEGYDLLIATPPCNYYSRANFRRDKSPVALATRHLLPDILEKFARSGKPFLVENVQNSRLLKPFADKYPCVYWGSHCFFTNTLAPVPYDKPVREYKQNMAYGHRDNNRNVDIFIRNWLHYAKEVI